MRRDLSRFPARKPLRLDGFDYSQAGAYFVTVVIQDRCCLLGEIESTGVRLSSPGELVSRTWQRLESRFRGLTLDTFVVMPNHLHGVLFLPGPGLDETVVTLPRAMQWFKTMTTNAYLRGVRSQGWPEVRRRFWQRGYHDRILRNEEELHSARDYIAQNPLKWHLDAENPT